MPPIEKPERVTQNRVIALFLAELVDYIGLGDSSDHKGNRNLKDGLLSAHLMKGG